jgi:hypothetical protein
MDLPYAGHLPTLGLIKRDTGGKLMEDGEASELLNTKKRRH